VVVNRLGWLGLGEIQRKGFLKDKHFAIWSGVGGVVDVPWSPGLGV
jgi:hypothetical protein